MKSVETLHLELIVARADYLDNQGEENADEFYSIYFRAYNAYWKRVDPSKVKQSWSGD